MMSTQAEDAFLTTSDVARRFNRTPDTIRTWERRGVLTAIRTANGQRLFRERDVDRLIAQRQAKKVK